MLDITRMTLDDALHVRVASTQVDVVPDCPSVSSAAPVDLVLSVIATTVIEAAASKVAGIPVIILCEVMPPTHIKGTLIEGYVDFNRDTGEPLPVIHLAKSNCRLLNHLDSKPSYNEGRALGYLNHEAWHIRIKSSDEPRVECLQWQNSWAMLKQFALPPKVNKVLLEGMKLAHEETPDSYQTKC